MTEQKLTRPWGPFLTGLVLVAACVALGLVAFVYIPWAWLAVTAMVLLDLLAALLLGASLVGFVTDRHPRQAR